MPDDVRGCRPISDKERKLVLAEAYENIEHGLTVEEWADTLLSLLPGHYRERPLPPCPVAFAPGSDAKIAAMEQRHAQGFSVHHPEDASDLPDRLGRSVGRGRNGAVHPGQVRVDRAPEERRAA